MFNDLMHGPPAKIDLNNDNVAKGLVEWSKYIQGADYEAIGGDYFHISDMLEPYELEKPWYERIFGALNGDHISDHSNYVGGRVDWMIADENYMENYSENYIQYIYPVGKKGSYYYIRAYCQTKNSTTYHSVYSLKFWKRKSYIKAKKLIGY